jgi:diguanylate cyclase (GGDEF)-like protein
MAVSARLTESVRVGDLVSRFGGGEFVVLCSALISQGHAIEVADRIQRAISSPFELDGLVLSISASIGLAFHSGDDPPLDADRLVGCADLAMYEAKRHGRARVETAESPATTDTPPTPTPVP